MVGTGTERDQVHDDETAWVKNKKGQDSEARASFSDMTEVGAGGVD